MKRLMTASYIVMLHVIIGLVYRKRNRKVMAHKF